jgi:hypothetical protein
MKWILPIVALVCLSAAPAATQAAVSGPVTPPSQGNCLHVGTHPHNNLMPAIRPQHSAPPCVNTKHPAKKSATRTTTPAATNPPSRPQPVQTAPDLGKPGERTMPDANRASVHAPGSENSQDTGGAPPKI